jgi:hypothetical protein
VFAVLAVVCPALADGVFFQVTGEAQAADLAQTRQEVLLATYRSASGADTVTYVLQTRYSGNPNAFAWVIPVPATPTGIVAHASSALFDELTRLTKPTFTIYELGGRGLGCACGALGAGGIPTGEQGGLVEVEATGQAGIFEWAALTSTGSGALLTWLNTNNYNVPESADTVLAGYIQQGMHFLAVRIDEPAQVQQGSDGQIEIPPIQYTCQTSQMFYPLAISQVSAASATEVLIYVLSDHRAEAANVTNVEIEANELLHDPSSPSLTNYESVFAQKIAENGGTALVTEYAQSSGRLDSHWPDAPAAAVALTFLTRMRTVIARQNMTLDFSFQDATSDETVSAEFMVRESSTTSAASLFGPSLGVLLVFGLFRGAVRRWGRVR